MPAAPAIVVNPQMSMLMWPGKRCAMAKVKLPAPRAARHPLRAARSTGPTMASRLAGRGTFTASSPIGSKAAASSRHTAGSRRDGVAGAATAATATACMAEPGSSDSMALLRRADRTKVPNQLAARKVKSPAASIVPPGNWIVGSMTCTGTRKTGSQRPTQPRAGSSAACMAAACAGATSAVQDRPAKAPSMPPMDVGKYALMPVASMEVLTRASKATKPPKPTAIFAATPKAFAGATGEL
mmetsp:Transcript_82783/g.210663  ORF Transcript_82783/g.210663 Transcript_82783/m.210663 type:complete len:241 (-) Transcript_82783:231-953(-)